MVFIDDLAIELFTVPIMTAIVVFMSLKAVQAYNASNYAGVKAALEGGAIPLLLIGTLAFIQAIWGEFTWTLPGSYNILFDDPYLLMSLILIAFSVSVLFGKKMAGAGVLSLFSGLVTIVYGYHAYSLGMTADPLSLLGIYGLYGLAAIAAFPLTLLLDDFMEGLAKAMGSAGGMSPQGPSPIPRAGGWLVQNRMLVMVVFWILIVFAGLVTGYVALSAIPAHLASAP